MNDKLLSVIMPVYNEVNIEPNFLRLINVLKSAEINYEIIIIDDGSRNNAWQEIADIAYKYDNVVGISFSRNFGKENALCAGLDAAKGDCAVCIDSDMQFPPEEIPEMYKLWEQGYEVVEGVKNKRQNEGFLYKVCSNTFYSALKKLSAIDLKNGSDFRLLDRSVIDAWKSMPERQTFFRGMSSWVGFKRIQYNFDVADRTEGKSKWSLRRLMGLAVDAVTSYTAAPLYMAAVFGVIFFLFAVVMGIQTLYMFIWGNALSGFTTVILLLLFIGAVVMLGLGVIGIYIKKIYEEVKGRPRYIIQRTVHSKNDKTGENNEGLV